MEKILARWESLSASSGIVRFLDINLRGIGQVMFQNNPLTGASLSGRDRLGFIRSWRTPRGDCRRPRRRRGKLDGPMASRRQGVAPCRALWIQRRPCRTCVGDISGSERAHVGLCGAGGGRFGRHDAWDRQRRQALGRIQPHVSFRADDVAPSVGHVRIFRPHRGCAAGRRVVVAFQPYEASPLKLIDLAPGCAPKHLTGLPEGEWRGRPSSARWPGRELVGCRRIRSRRCDTGGSDGPSFRCRKRADHWRSSRLQPGSDGDRAGCRVLPTELAGRGLRHAGHAVHGRCAGSAERCPDAVRHSCTYCAFCARHMDIPSSTPVFRAGVGCNSRCRDSAYNLDLCFFLKPTCLT